MYTFGQVRELPTPERRLLLVTSAHRYQQLFGSSLDYLKERSAGLLKRAGGKLTRNKDLFGGAAGFALIAGAMPLASGAAAAAGLGGMIGCVALLGYGGIRRGVALWKGQLPLMPGLTPTDASRTFRFDPGHPVSDTIYALHPFENGLYVAAHELERRLAHDEMVALHELAGALGAKQIKVTNASMSDQERPGDLTLQGVADTLGLKVIIERNRFHGEVVSATWPQPSTPPLVPERLRPWLDADSSFKALVHGRLEREQNAMTVRLVVQERFEGLFSLGAVAERYRLSIGCRWVKMSTSNWEFEVDFWPVAIGD